MKYEAHLPFWFPALGQVPTYMQRTPSYHFAQFQEEHRIHPKDNFVLREMKCKCTYRIESTGA